MPAILLLFAGTVHGTDAATGGDPGGSSAAAPRRSAGSLPEGDIHSFDAGEPSGAGPSAQAGKPAPGRAAMAAAKTAPAPGGGIGQVWVNASSKAYHCEGTPYYGRTKRGEYMTEAAAKAAGAHPARGRPCP